MLGDEARELFVVGERGEGGLACSAPWSLASSMAARLD
jgi:hypothetical protein